MVVDELTDEGHASRGGGCRWRNRLDLCTIRVHPPCQLLSHHLSSPILSPITLDCATSLPCSTTKPLPRMFPSLEILILYLLCISKCSPFLKTLLKTCLHQEGLPDKSLHTLQPLSVANIRMIMFLPGLSRSLFGFKRQKSISKWLMQMCVSMCVCVCY